jgi:hypothetical protein
VKKVVVIDGLGGGIGAELVSRLKELKDSGKIELIALCTNATATERLVKAGATRGATGENAIRVSVGSADIILGPIGIILADSMMGEITADITKAILSSHASRILLPLKNDHITLAGFDGLSLSKMIDRAVELVREEVG